ncbi:hypothetical protein A1O1_05649 [Capronia coronata CBS 617.96]|uniref:Ig-like domain-containing protein n=1 Tax=Capronia coronata CBS 617.96 TaxID=1182541 RepID=W9Y794_9EURO|nr:uncharacterized protein A1O1_05649 [Capronia coronata CBS 617.96]EXJ88717.1 hypothetical protein A1O1_05649 [Capronia coronata CBS 617.96]
MCNHLTFIIAGLASFVLSYAVEQPVVPDRIVRRCDNETHSLLWPYSNTSLTQSAYGPSVPGTAASGLTAGLPAGLPFSWPCGYGGLPCFPTATNPTAGATSAANASWTQSVATASNSSSQSFNIGPEMTSTPSSSFDQSAASTSRETSTAAESSLSGNVTTNATTSFSPDHSSGASITLSNATLSGGSSSYVAMTTLTTNATATVFLNHTRTVGPPPPMTFPCRNSLGSTCFPANETYAPTGSGTGGWAPRGSNASTNTSQGLSSAVETPSRNVTELVATLTIGSTPSLEVVTLTATVDVGGLQTSSRVWGNGTGAANATGTGTGPISSAKPDVITMTIVVASNSTAILGTQTSLSTANASNTVPTSSSESVTASATAITGNTTSVTNMTLSPATTESTSSLSVFVSATGTGNSTLSFINGTLTGTETTSAPYWGNTTSSTPCPWEVSDSSRVWSDWNLTALSLTYKGNSSASAQTTFNSQIATAAPTPQPTFSASLSVSSPTANSTTTSESDNSQIQVTPTTLPANISSSSDLQLGSTMLSGQGAPTGLSPNASTICLANATVASCPSTAAPWLSTAAITGTAGGSGRTTLTTSFVSNPNSSVSNTGGSVVPRWQAKARSANDVMPLKNRSARGDRDKANAPRHTLDETAEERVLDGEHVGWVGGVVQ